MGLWDDIFNELNDESWAWWPFSFLRPAKHEPMSNRLVFVLSVLYGVLVGMLTNILFAIGEAPVAKMPLIFPLGVPVVMFVFYRLTFARAWNRRAARLSVLAAMEREEA